MCSLDVKLESGYKSPPSWKQLLIVSNGNSFEASRTPFKNLFTAQSKANAVSSFF